MSQIYFRSLQRLPKGILRDPEAVKELAKAFQVTTKSVRSALDGVTQSDLAKRIRKRALDMGLKEKGTEQAIVLN